MQQKDKRYSFFFRCLLPTLRSDALCDRFFFTFHGHTTFYESTLFSILNDCVTRIRIQFLPIAIIIIRLSQNGGKFYKLLNYLFYKLLNYVPTENNI